MELSLLNDVRRLAGNRIPAFCSYTGQIFFCPIFRNVAQKNVYKGLIYPKAEICNLTSIPTA
jgi:hypothetical protein